MSQSTASTSTVPATSMTVTESTHFTYDPDTGLLTQTVTDDGVTTHLCYYSADRSNKVPALTTLLAKFKLEGADTLLSTAMALTCPTIADTTSRPLMAQCNYIKFPDGSLSEITLTLFGYAQASIDGNGLLVPDTVLNLEGVSVDTSTIPWTVAKAVGREGITVSLQQVSNSLTTDKTVTETISTRWYKDNKARQTQKLTETTTADTTAGTLRAKSESPLQVGQLKITSILSQHIRSARSGRVLRETRQDELGRPTAMVYHTYDARDRLLSSIHYDWNSDCFEKGEGNGIGEIGTFEQWLDQGNGTWVTSTGPDGRVGRTLLDGLQRPVRRELQREIGDDQSASNYLCVEEIAYGADGEVQQQCTYDYLPGGLCVRNDGAVLSSHLRDWFWEVEQHATTADAKDTQSHSTVTLSGTLLKGPLRSLEATQRNHEDGQVTLTRRHKRWDPTKRSMEDLGLVIEQRVNNRGQYDQVIETVNSVDRLWKHEYDELGRRIKIAAPDGTLVQWAYQGLSTTPIEVSVKAASGEKKVIGRQGLRGAGNQGDDVLSRTVGQADSTRTYTFDDNGHKRPDGTRIWSESSEDGATVSWYTERAASGVSIPKTLVASFSYNSITQAMTAERPETEENLQSRISSEVLAPELFGQLRAERTIRGVRQVRRSLHSLRGNVDTVQLPSGMVSRTWRDSQNRRSRVRRGRLEYRYRYTEQGELDRLVVQDMQSGRRMTVCYDYDSFGRETERTYRLDGVLKSRYEQSWSVIGQLVSKTWYRNGEAAATRTESYTYEKTRNELKLWSVSAAKGYEIQDGGGKSIKDQAYTYDALGNILTCTTHYLDGASELRCYTYGNTQQPTQRTRLTVTHTAKDGKASEPTVIDLVSDENGSLKNDARGQSLSYTSVGQLQSVSTAEGGKPNSTYEYDERGRLAGQWDEVNQQRRILEYCDEQLSGEVWLDPHDNLLRQRTFDEQAGLVVHCRHIGEERDSWQTYFMLSDPQNGAAEEYSADSDGAWQSQAVGYTPWGEAPLERLNALNSGLGYNGQRIDPVTGGYHLGHGQRVYQPEHQAFFQSDSLSPFAEGGLNDLAYCAGRDPVNWHDPSGHIMINRREEASSLASLDEMIRDTTPPHHEPAAWWEWLILSVVFVAAIVGAVVTGGLLGVLFLAIAGLSFGLGAAELALRQSNPALSSKLGWASLGTGLFDASGKGLVRLGSLLLKGVRRGLQGLNVLRKAAVLKLGSIFKGVQGTQRVASAVSKRAGSASSQLGAKSASTDFNIMTLGGEIDSPTPIYFKTNLDKTSGVWIAFDEYNVKGAFLENITRIQKVSSQANKALKNIDDVVAATGASGSKAQLAELNTAISKAKNLEKDLFLTSHEMAKLNGELVDAEAAFQKATRPYVEWKKINKDFSDIEQAIRSGNVNPTYYASSLADFIDEHKLYTSSYKGLKSFLPINKSKVVRDALKEVKPIIQANGVQPALDMAAENAKLKAAHFKVRPKFNDVYNKAEDFNDVMGEVGEKFLEYTQSLPAAVIKSKGGYIKKASKAIRVSTLQPRFPLNRLKIMVHGAAPGAKAPGPAARAVVQINPPQPGQIQSTPSYLDANDFYTQLRGLKDSAGNALIKFDDVDVIHLMMCHGAAGGKKSFASEFSKLTGKVVKANEFKLTAGYTPDKFDRALASQVPYVTPLPSNSHFPAMASFLDGVADTVNKQIYLRSIKLSADPRVHNVVYVPAYFFPLHRPGMQSYGALKQWLRTA